MIKDNENEAENENIYTTLVGLGLDMDTKILTIKCVSVYQYTMLICIKQHLSNIAQFIKKLSNTEADLKKSVSYMKKSVSVYFTKRYF